MFDFFSFHFSFCFFNVLLASCYFKRLLGDLNLFYEDPPVFMQYTLQYFKDNISSSNNNFSQKIILFTQVAAKIIFFELSMSIPNVFMRPNLALVVFLPDNSSALLLLFPQLYLLSSCVIH